MALFIAFGVVFFLYMSGWFFSEISFVNGFYSKFWRGVCGACSFWLSGCFLSLGGGLGLGGGLT